MMMRLHVILCIYWLVRLVDAFQANYYCVGRSVSILDFIRQVPVRNRGIILALDDADVSLEGDIDSFMDGDMEEVAAAAAAAVEAATEVEAEAPVPKKKAPKRKPKASVMTVNDESTTTDSETTTTATSPAPVTVPSKIYYRAKEDNEIYAVSTISIDDTVITLKDLKKLLVEANEWPESSRVIFYSGEERLAFTTALNECLLDNTADKPLAVTVLTTTTAAISESPVIAGAPQFDESAAPEEVSRSIDLYQGRTTSSVTPDLTDTNAMMTDVNNNNADLVKNIITPTPQAPLMPGPKTGRGAVVDLYSHRPAPQSPEWANRLSLEAPRLQQMQQSTYPPPPARPTLEETGRFWMNKISLDLGVVLVAKVMKALERSQFLVLAAPGGYGKTSLLQLLERVYEKQGKCVVRFRILQDTDVYHQFQTSSGIDLKNAYIHDLRPNYQKVILIDDAHKVYDTPGFWEVLLKKFPTWCFAWDYTIIFAVTLPVAQGSPIIELLGDPSIPHLGPKDFAPDQQ